MAVLSKYYFQIKPKVPVELEQKCWLKNFLKILGQVGQALSDVKVIKYRLDRSETTIFDQ